MAIRNVVAEGDPILYKKCKAVENFDNRLWNIIDDISDTMIHLKCIGLAAPHVGILKRIVTVNIDNNITELINPEIIDSQGSQEGEEGSISCLGQVVTIIRPKIVKIKAQNRFGKNIEIFGEGLKARVLCHEIDQTNGIFFKSKAISANTFRK